MPDAKTESRPTLERYIPLVGAVMALSPLVLLFFQNPIIFCAVNVIAAIAFMVVVTSWNAGVLSERSAILGGDGNPIDLPFFRDRKRKWGFVFAVVGVFVFAWLYFWRFDLMAPASITTFTASSIRYNDEAGENQNVKSFVYPARDYFVETDEEATVLEITCHSSAKMVVSRSQHFQGRTLCIEAVDFDVKHIVYTAWGQRRGVGPHKVEQTRYKVPVNPDSTRVRAIMLDQKGNPTEGTLVLNEDHVFADMHFRFEGKTGLYRVTPQVTIMDGPNRHIITQSSPLYMGVMEDDWDPDAEKTKVKPIHSDDKTEALLVFKDGRERGVKLRKVQLPDSQR